MIRYRTTWIVLCQIVMVAIIGWMGCKPAPAAGSKDTGLAAYYFPIDSFPPEGLLYTYRNKVDSTAAPEIWRYRRWSPGHMVSTNYTPEGIEVLNQFDRFVHNGVLTDSFHFVLFDSLEQKQLVRAKVISPNRFPFDVIDSSTTWVSKLDWNQPGDSLRIVLERRRKYMGPATWQFEGKNIPAVRFITEDRLETERDGWTTSVWPGEEIYAYGLGLVYYKRAVTEGMTLEYELERIAPAR